MEEAPEAGEAKADQVAAPLQCRAKRQRVPNSRLIGFDLSTEMSAGLANRRAAADYIRQFPPSEIPTELRLQIQMETTGALPAAFAKKIPLLLKKMNAVNTNFKKSAKQRSEFEEIVRSDAFKERKIHSGWGTGIPVGSLRSRHGIYDRR